MACFVRPTNSCLRLKIMLKWSKTVKQLNEPLTIVVKIYWKQFHVTSLGAQIYIPSPSFQYREFNPWGSWRVTRASFLICLHKIRSCEEVDWRQAHLRRHVLDTVADTSTDLCNFWFNPSWILSLLFQSQREDTIWSVFLHLFKIMFECMPGHAKLPSILSTHSSHPALSW